MPSTFRLERWLTAARKRGSASLAPLKEGMLIIYCGHGVAKPLAVARQLDKHHATFNYNHDYHHHHNHHHHPSCIIHPSSLIFHCSSLLIIIIALIKAIWVMATGKW